MTDRDEIKQMLGTILHRLEMAEGTEVPGLEDLRRRLDHAMGLLMLSSEEGDREVYEILEKALDDGAVQTVLTKVDEVLRREKN